jgi:hypothetical protein
MAEELFLRRLSPRLIAHIGIEEDDFIVDEVLDRKGSGNLSAQLTWITNAAEEMSEVEAILRDVLQIDHAARLVDFTTSSVHDKQFPSCVLGPQSQLSLADAPSDEQVSADDFSWSIRIAILSEVRHKIGADALLRVLQQRLPELLPSRVGTSEPLRSVQTKPTDQVLHELFQSSSTDVLLWEGRTREHQGILVSHSSHGEGYASGGPIDSLTLSLPIRAHATVPVSVETIVQLATSLQALEIDVVQDPSSGDGGYAYAGVAPLGWWIGFDSLDHHLVYLAKEMAEELGCLSRENDYHADWRPQSDGAMVYAPSIDQKRKRPLASLCQVIDNHVLPAKARPWSLLPGA